MEALFVQGITPLVPLRRKEMEEIPTWKRRAKDPAQEAKHQAKVRDVQIRNQARLIQQQGGYRSIQALRTRCEHVFAEGKECHGLDRARSRGLYAMEEQALLTAVVQNLKRLCRFRKKTRGGPALWRAQNRNWEQEVLLVFPSFGAKRRGEWPPKFDMWEVYAPLIHRPSKLKGGNASP